MEILDEIKEILTNKLDVNNYELKTDTGNIETASNIIIYTYFNSGCWIDELISIERELFKLVRKINNNVFISAIKFNSPLNAITFNFGTI